MSIVHRTSDSNNLFVKRLKYIGELIAVASLLFAVITYWISYSSEQNYYDNVRANLNIELNNIYYFSVIADLINYESELEEIEKNNFDGMPILAYETPILDYLFSSGDIIKIFSNYSTIEALRMIKVRLKARNNITVLKFSGKQHMDWYMKEQTIPIHNIINSIAESEEYINLYHNDPSLSDNKKLDKIYRQSFQYNYFVNREILAQTILALRLPKVRTKQVKTFIVKVDSINSQINTVDSLK